MHQFLSWTVPGWWFVAAIIGCFLCALIGFGAACLMAAADEDYVYIKDCSCCKEEDV